MSKSDSPPTASPRKQLAYAAAALVLATFIAYGPTLSSEFIRLDDPQYVINNALVRNPSLSGAIRFIREVQKPSTVAGYYQPLTMLSLMLDAFITGHGEVSPAVCHFTNILLHGATCVLIMLLLREIVGGLAIPFILALVFAIHPVNVESVAWISQRKTVLATPLAMGCLLAYIRYGRTARLDLLWVSVGLYILANLAKPTIVLLPLVLPFLDVWPLRRPVRIAEKWPFVPIMVVLSYVAFISQASSIATIGVPTVGSAAVFGKWISLLAYNLTLYLGNIFWPLYLSPYRPVPSSLSFASAAIALSCVLTLGVIGVAVVSRRKYPPLFVGLAGFTIALLPALGPVRFFDSCVSDRFLYFPIVFLLMTAAAAVSDIESLSRQRVRLLRYAICLSLVPLLILMRAQQQIWQNGVTFWRHVADAVPDYPIAQVMLGICYFDLHMIDEAEQHASKAHEMAPTDADAINIMARVKIERNHAGEAVTFLRASLTKVDVEKSASPHLALAEALTVTGDLAAARGELARAVKLGAESAAAHEQIGDAAMQKAKRFEFAAWAYRAALEARPENMTARWNLGTCLEALGDDAGALKEYEDAMRRFERVGRPSDMLRGSIQRLRMKLEGRGVSPPTFSKPGGGHGP